VLAALAAFNVTLAAYAVWRMHLKKTDEGQVAAVERDHWQLTEKCKDEAKRVKQNATMADAKYREGRVGA
jgi:hypothetical protein